MRNNVGPHCKNQFVESTHFVILTKTYDNNVEVIATMQLSLLHTKCQFNTIFAYVTQVNIQILEQSELL